MSERSYVIFVGANALQFRYHPRPSRRTSCRLDYILLSVPVLVLLIAFCAWAWKRWVSRKLVNAANLVKTGLVMHLERIYVHGLDSSDAALLARAVVAYVFCEAHRAEETLNYARENTGLIEKEARRLGGDPDVCRMITYAVLAEIQAACWSVKRIDHVAVQKFQRIRELGLWPAGVEQPGTRVFCSAARAFYERNKETPDQAPPAPPALTSASISAAP